MTFFPANDRTARFKTGERYYFLHIQKDEQHDDQHAPGKKTAKRTMGVINISHITAVKTKITLKNQGMIERAIAEMSKTFQGMRIERPYPDVILVRYAPIEGYQTEGNLQFVLNPQTGIWEMQYDFWQCQSDVEKVRDAFLVEYQKAGVISFCASAGYMTTSQKVKEGILLTASKY